MTFLRNNPGLAIVLGLIAASTLILSLIGILMKRSGSSPRPLWWMAGFMALVLAPQLAGHLYNAFAQTGAPQPGPADAEATRIAVSSLSVSNAFDPEQLFGEKGRGAVVAAGQAQANGVLSEAQPASFMILITGETAFVGRFASPNRARDAVTQYLAESGLGDKAQGDAAAGFFAVRGAGDFVHVRAFGALFAALTGPDEAAIQTLLRSPGFLQAAGISSSEAATVATTSITGSSSPAERLLGEIAASTPGLLALVLLSGGYLLLVVCYFFRGVAWAARIPAVRGVKPASAEALKAQLMGVNALEAPFKVEADLRGKGVLATWRYADAKWIDLARVRGMKRQHKVVLDFDEQTHTVRATDFAAGYDWSAGAGGADLEWRAMTGVTLFQYEHRRVFGLELDPNGRFMPVLSYAYTFNLQEMKEPLIAAVTQSGWQWRPTAWNSPSWLRWLTG